MNENQHLAYHIATLVLLEINPRAEGSWAAEVAQIASNREYPRLPLREWLALLHHCLGSLAHTVKLKKNHGLMTDISSDMIYNLVFSSHIMILILHYI